MAEVIVVTKGASLTIHIILVAKMMSSPTLSVNSVDQQVK